MQILPIYTNNIYTETQASVGNSQYIPSFTGISKLKTAQTALDKLNEHINDNSPLTQDDEKWLSKLKQVLGTSTMIINDPDSPKKLVKKDTTLTIDRINQDNGAIVLSETLKAMLGATLYKPLQIKLDKVNYSVHNESIAGFMRSEYTLADFRNLVTYLNSKHVFDMSDNTKFGLVIDKTRGIVKTCGAEENWEMSSRAWITDIMRVGDIQKKKRPETWTIALNTVAAYYKKQNRNFKTLIENPDLYRSDDATKGIPHIFMPKTLEPDENWFNNKRLESHGLALKEFCLGITDGLVRHKKFGYKSAESIPDDVICAIDNLSKYFKAIDYTSAPSAGNWEEIPIKDGLTSDTEMIRSALVAYKNLLYNPKYNTNAEIIKIRKRLDNKKPLSEKELDKLIDEGTQRVRKTYLEEAPLIRPHDASLVFVTTSDIKLADNVIDDVKKHVEILESLEKHLVRENGIIRYSPFKIKLKDGSEGYSPDSYLNLNYFNAIDKNGKLNLDWKKTLEQFASKDCSEPTMFFARAKFSSPDKEAQWFMVSEMSTGYGKQIEKLFKNAQKNKRKLSEEEKQLIKYLKKKQTEYLNRALSRISAEKPSKKNQMKANGLDMPPVTISEAHQYISDIYGKPKMMQGTNAPLAWAVTSLYKAINEEKLILKLLK